MSSELISLESALFWMELLVSLSIAIQTLEMISIKEVYSSNGIWRWSDLKPEVGNRLGWILEGESFFKMLWVRLAVAVLFPFFPNPVFAVILFLSTVLISIRWRGTFNGGSDYMTTLVLGAITVSHFFEFYSKPVIASVTFVGIQVCLSYFIAGFVKVIRPEWRSGAALSQYLKCGYYDVGKAFQSIPLGSPLWVIGSWGVMLVDLISPLAAISPAFCIYFIPLALGFHLLNAYAFGLNRFFFAWAAAMPALLYCSGLFG